LRNIQDRIALREIDRKLANETSSIIQSQIDKAKAITANSEKALALEAKFQGLTEEDLRNPEKLKQILSETNALLSQGSDLTKAEAEALEIKINAIIENNQLEKDSLKFKSTIIRSLQSAAVDNEKEQILGKININNETLPVVKVLSMAGYPSDLISLIISQPIVREYAEELQKASYIQSLKDSQDI
jgi:type IV secretory pathway VirJ component